MIRQFSLLRHWPLLAGLLLGMCFLVLPITGYDLGFFPGDLGDGRFNNYLLEHAYGFVKGNVHAYLNAPFMFPEKNVLSYSDNLLGTSPFYFLFRELSLDKETSFVLWFISLTTLNYIFCYLFLRGAFFGNYAAAAGAMIFAFSIALQSQLTHAQTFARFPIPLAFWLCIIFMRKWDPVYFFLVLAVVAYQVYCGIYLGLFLALSIFLCMAIIFLHNRLKFIAMLKNMRWAAQMSGSLLLFVLMLIPLLIPYTKRLSLVGTYDYHAVFDTLPTLKSFAFSQSGSLFWNFLSHVGYHYPAFWDHQLFPGGVPMLSTFFVFAALVLKYAFRRRLVSIGQSPEATVFLLTMVLVFALFTRFGDFSLYQFIYHLPGFSSLRSLTRIISVELLLFSFTTAFVLEFINKYLKRHAGAVFLFFALLITADMYFKQGRSYRTSIQIARERINHLLPRMNDLPKGTVISYEPEQIHDNPVFYQLDAMIASQQLGLVSVNGYSATSPRSYTNYYNHPDSLSRSEWLYSQHIAPSTPYVVR